MLIVLIKANLFLGAIDGKFWHTVAFMFAAGFSERFVVKQLTKLAGDKDQRDGVAVRERNHPKGK